MKQIPIKLGPLALLLTVISICLTTLAILTFTTARADKRLAEKYANTVSVRYELEAKGQEWLASVEKGEISASENGLFETVIQKDGAVLSISATVSDGRIQVQRWKHTREWEQDMNIGNLWNGN